MSQFTRSSEKLGRSKVVYVVIESQLLVDLLEEICSKVWKERGGENALFAITVAKLLTP